MRYLYHITLCVLLATAGVACNRTSKNSFDMQKVLQSKGVSVRKITLNPAMLTPFLDNKKPEEAALKEFLYSINEVSIFNLPNKQVLDDVAKHAQNNGYRQKIDLQQEIHRMWVYAFLTKDKRVTSLIMLLQEEDSAFYAVEMSGNVNCITLMSLSRISPEFFDSYIRRFNVKF